ncbi:WG repeat-containing protein [Roseivirga sp.]|uniref:WG repeat-containing protein n=1 Tax=Roseivirga sp. TaxID=1964215 RepID=UPI002B27106F|nr:WG repeat-containing protein [Roseivirga sp.]
MKPILSIFSLFLMLTCSNNQILEQAENKYYEIIDFKPTDTLYRVSANEYQLGEEFGYINQKGDTIIPNGLYIQSFSDTIINYGFVVQKIGDRADIIAINQKGQKLYEVHWFDNGPDYIENGAFRILRNGKIGFADSTGKIIVTPQFDCAYPFSDGKAKVSYECDLVKDLEHTAMKSHSWFYIDKNGQRIKLNK